MSGRCCLATLTVRCPSGIGLSLPGGGAGVLFPFVYNMATTKRTPTMRSRASAAARHVPAIAPIVLRRTMRTFPPLPIARTVFGDPLPSPPSTSVASTGDVHPDHSYALIALGAGASVPPAPPMPRAPLWRSVAQAPLALRNRRAFIGPRTRSWYLYRGLYHPQVKPT